MAPEIARCRPWLGTFVTIRASGAERSALERGVEAAYARIARVHRLMSVHDPSSEASRLNGSAHLEPVRVSEETYEVLSLAVEMHHASGRAFDITVAPALMRWGFIPGEPISDDTGTTADIVLEGGGFVRFTRPLQIDFGGIAKGFAVDLAVDALRNAGVPSGLVNAGGDLRVFGSNLEVIHVRPPGNPRRSVPLAEIRDAAVATSAAYFSTRRSGADTVTPIVEPRSRTACVSQVSVSTVAPTCAVADALTKVVLLRGSATASVLSRYSAAAATIDSAGLVTFTGEGHAA